MENIKKSYQVLNGFQLKMIGIILMVLDHIHQMFSMMGAPLWLTCVGRLVAPIFIFLCAEGFHYTRSKKKYMIRLLCGFWFMNVMTMIIQGVFPLDNIVLMNNIFGTLFYCTFYMLFVDKLVKYIKEKKFMKVLLCLVAIIVPLILAFVIMPLAQVNLTLFRILFTIIPIPLFVEGGISFIVMGVAIYLLRRSRMLQMLPILLVGALSYVSGGGIQGLMVFAIIPLLLYNGEQGRKSKYFFYVFYPAHIYILYILSYLVQTKL